MTNYSVGAVTAIMLTLSTTVTAAPVVFEASGVSVDSNNPTHTDIEFGSIPRVFPKLFTTFSPERLSAP